MTKLQFWILAIGLWISCGFAMVWMIDYITIDHTEMDSIEVKTEVESPDRMMIVEEFEQGSYHFKIWTDTETNVMYLQLGTQGGLTVMLDTDGKPILYEDKQNDS